jgi:hypothetical protein
VVYIEQIKYEEVDNLSVSWEAEEGFVMLFTPDMNDKMEHHHIELSKEEAFKLAAFLTEYSKQ